MAQIIPFPIVRSRGATRASRIFRAQTELERARRQTVVFFGSASLAVVVLISGLELLTRLY